MKKSILLAGCALVLLSCQESLERHAQREMRLYSEKNCPQRVSETITLDSCSFDIATRTLNYYYSFTGAMDNDSIGQKADAMRNLILDVLKNDTKTRIYKEAGYSFHYVYFSGSEAGKVRFQTTFTKNDY